MVPDIPLRPPSKGEFFEFPLGKGACGWAVRERGMLPALCTHYVYIPLSSPFEGGVCFAMCVRVIVHPPLSSFKGGVSPLSPNGEGRVGVGLWLKKYCHCGA